MDWNAIANWGVPVLGGVIGWFWKQLADMRADHVAFRLKVAEEYVTTHDLSDIKDMLRRIEDKLDGKADK